MRRIYSGFAMVIVMLAVFIAGIWERAKDETGAVAMFGIVDKIPRFDPLKIPIGDAARGHVSTAIADTVGSLAIRFAPGALTNTPYSAAILKLGLAALFQVKQVKNFIGPQSSDVASLILTYEGLGSIYNIRAKLNSVLSGIAGKAMPASGGTPAAVSGTEFVF